ncbi:MAG: HNH endonuclease [Bacteroidales bacterium]|nr:HNH endonuclease [Bacteroidales bacterium]
MSFDPGLKIGQIIKNADLVEIFKCGNMGGMRRSRTTNTLVIVSDYTKGIYHDKWIGGVLHYTGMGKSGDQDINWAQNATLAECGRNGVDVHLFEVMDAGEYVYCGRIELVSKPYTEIQPGEDGNDRRVWMFPVRPVPDNDVKKPQMFVFKDMDDYKTRGKNVDEEYAKMIADKKKSKGKAPVVVQPVIPKPEPKPPVVIPADIVGKPIKHKSFGTGVITAIEGTTIAVEFDKVGLKKMGYEFCMKNKLLEFI